MLIAAFAGALYLLPKPWWAAVVALVIITAGWEWARLAKLDGIAAWIYGAGIAAVFVLVFLSGEHITRGVFVLATLFWAVVVPIWLARGVRAEHRPALIVAGFVVLVPAGVALAVLKPNHVLLALVLVWIADSGAYFVGRKWGRRKLAPAISPGKSWEGVWGGMAAAVAYAIICGTFLMGPAWLPVVAVAAALLAAISVVGDLFESAAKRQAGAKDSGALLPGHGGVLDRIDSATAVLPVVALLLALPKP